jgi:hypothetical protein
MFKIKWFLSIHWEGLTRSNSEDVGSNFLSFIRYYLSKNITMGSVHVRKKMSKQVLSSEMIFHNPWGSIWWISLASNRVTLMIFLWLSMVGQIFCFYRQWWASSIDVYFHAQWGVASNDCFFFHQWGVISSDFFFPPPRGGHFQMIFFPPRSGVILSDIFFHHKWGVNSSDFFFPLPMGGHFKWFFFGH